MNDQTHVNMTDAQPALPGGQTVTSVHHWTDWLFSFRVTRPASLRFRSGEFVMIGLLGDKGKPLLRAYSIASPSWDDELEFYSIKVDDGPLTSKLQLIQPGDQVIVKTKPTGTLVLDALLPAKRVYLLGTGTGVAPWASLVRDPDLYDRYDEVILTHTTRTVAELDYSKLLVENAKNDPLIGEEATAKLRYLPTTTRENSAHMGRITTLLENGSVQNILGLPALNPETDRVMICGSMALNTDMKRVLEDRGFVEGANSNPQHYVIEKAFVG
jgi:ferredoxin--NADP+ reductase